MNAGQGLKMINAFVNLLVSLPIIAYCILQVASSAACKYFTVWVINTLLLLMAIFNAFQPWLLGEFPQAANVLGSAAIALMILTTHYRARN